MNDCEWVQEHGPDLVRGDAVPEGIAAHRSGCADCRSVASGAQTLRVELDAWTAAEPPDDLVAKTLARLALASLGGAVTATTATTATVTAASEAVVAKPGSLRPTEDAFVKPADEGSIHLPELPPAAPIRDIPAPTPVFKVHGQRRSSIMILTGTRKDELESAAPPTGKRLFLRLCTQAAAAVVLFSVCTTFVAVFYPAVTFALEDRRVKRCQKQLSRLAKAAMQYHSEHPEAKQLNGGQLRRVLVTGGYADELDFVCTGHSGEAMGVRSYVGLLPSGLDPIDPDQPIYWDRFANHSSGFNVVYSDGRVETVSAEKFATWRQR